MGPVRNMDDLMAVGHGYQRAMILFAALKLGVFRGLAAGGCDASALAPLVALPRSPLGPLLVLGLQGRTVRAQATSLDATRKTLATCLPAVDTAIQDRTVEIPDLGTMTVAEWTPLIAGHLAGHVDQAFAIMTDREFLPEGI